MGRTCQPWNNKGDFLPGFWIEFALFLFGFSTSLSLAGNLEHLTQVRHSSLKSSATHSCQCVQYFWVSRQFGSPYPGKAHPRQGQRYPVCSVFECSDNGMAASVWKLPLCTQMLMHAHTGGCTDTARESALEVDSGRKILCCTGDLNPCQYCAWLFSQTLYPLSCPCAYLVWGWGEASACLGH